MLQSIMSIGRSPMPRPSRQHRYAWDEPGSAEGEDEAKADGRQRLALSQSGLRPRARPSPRPDVVVTELSLGETTMEESAAGETTGERSRRDSEQSSEFDFDGDEKYSYQAYIRWLARGGTGGKAGTGVAAKYSEAMLKKAEWARNNRRKREFAQETLRRLKAAQERKLRAKGKGKAAAPAVAVQKQDEPAAPAAAPAGEENLARVLWTRTATKSPRHGNVVIPGELSAEYRDRERAVREQLEHKSTAAVVRKESAAVVDAVVGSPRTMSVPQLDNSHMAILAGKDARTRRPLVTANRYAKWD